MNPRDPQHPTGPPAGTRAPSAGQDAASGPASTGRYGFGRSRRLRGRRAFAAVFHAAVRRDAGPLRVYVRPNDLSHWRLGLSVNRRIGSAVRRNRIKRLIRESFRLSQHDWPGSYDVVIVVRRAEPVTMAEYRRLLSTAATALHRRWCRRRPTEPGGQ